MDLVNLSIGIVAVIATLAGSWSVGNRVNMKANLEVAADVIGMLSAKINILEQENQALRERLNETDVA